ncbi:MAG: pyridine nucleotide-disulfide oxidoreductase, partial [Spirochaetes bacterium]
QAEQMGAETIRGEIVSIEDDNGLYRIVLSKGNRIESRSVILAPGCQPRQLGIPGEKEFLGKGVSYCATCDAELYEEATVVIVGSGDTAVEEANYISRYADRVLMVVVHDEGTLDCNKTMAEEAFANPKLVWLWNHSLSSIQGDEIVNGVTLKDLKKGTEEHIECDGVFMFVGIIPQTAFLKGFVNLERGYITANDRMETEKPLVYAAGDARVKTLRQVVTAASDGAIAAFYADKALSELDGYSRAMEGTNGECLLYFYTPPVQRSLELFPIVEKKAEDLKIPLRKFDIYRYKNTAARFGIKEVPALIHLKDEKKLREIKL